MVVDTKGVDESLGHLEQPQVEDELKEGEEGHHQVCLVPAEVNEEVYEVRSVTSESTFLPSISDREGQTI